MIIVHPHREIVNDICENCGSGYCTLVEVIKAMNSRKEVESLECNGCREYCPVKEYILGQPIDDRTLEQLKCVEKFKWDVNKERKEDMGWDAAWRLWVSMGYHNVFREVYKDGMKNGELYSAITKIRPVRLRA